MGPYKHVVKLKSYQENQTQEFTGHQKKEYDIFSWIPERDNIVVVMAPATCLLITLCTSGTNRQKTHGYPRALAQLSPLSPQPSQPIVELPWSVHMLPLACTWPCPPYLASTAHTFSFCRLLHSEAQLKQCESEA